MKDKLQEITKRAMEQIDAAEEMSALNDVRVAVLGKKGELTAVLKSMKDVKPEDRPAVGQLVNETRSAIEEKLAEAKERMEEAELDHRLKSEVIDVTLPAKKAKIGHLHPNTNVLQEVEDIFVGIPSVTEEGGLHLVRKIQRPEKIEYVEKIQLKWGGYNVPHFNK